MRVLYIYDLKFKNFKGELYSKNFSQKTWMKYMSIIEEMEAYVNVEDISEQPSLEKVTTENVTFIQINKLSVFEKLKLFNDTSNYDLIIIRMPSKLGIFLGILAVIKRKNMAVEVVGNFYEALMLHGRMRNKILAWPLHMNMKWLVKKATVAIYVTKEYLQTVYPNKKKNFVVPNAIIENNEFVPLRIQPVKIGMIGALNVEYKGHHILFEALKKVDQLNQQIEISLLGEGKLVLPFEYNNITINHLGLLSGEDLNNWYKSLSMYVQPSLTEAGGRSVMEAMSFSLPVIASNVGGIPELVDEEALVEKNDSLALANTIERFISTPHLQQQHAKRNFELIQAYDIVHNQAARDAMLRYLKELSSKETNYEKIH